MAVINLSVTISDSDMPRLFAAARGAFGPVPDGQGGTRDMSEAEVIEGIRQHGIGLIQQLVRNYERKVALAAAEALDPQIVVV